MILLLTSDNVQFMLTVIANRFRTSGLDSGGVKRSQERREYGCDISLKSGVVSCVSLGEPGAAMSNLYGLLSQNVCP